MEFDLVIRGGDVIDGTGNARQRVDVGVVGGRVAAMGDLREAVAAQDIDASQRIVAPGFIDVHIIVTDGYGVTNSKALRRCKGLPQKS